MEKDNSSCSECSGAKSKGLKIIGDLNDMYSEQLKQAKEASGGSLQLQIKTLEHWVSDLTEQNKTLVEVVEQLEDDALSKAKDSHPKKDVTVQKVSSTEKNVIESSHHELEKVKRQLEQMTNLEAKYLKDIQDLKAAIEKELNERTVIRSKTTVHCSTMTEIHDADIAAFQYQLDTTKSKLAESVNEIAELQTSLSVADTNVQRIQADLFNTEQNARDMRAALTAEVAEKHDQILSLKREVSHLEDKLRQADMQTHFKDDIIKKLREDVKVARSKETLAEVLGITEKSKSSRQKIEELRQQLQHKDEMIDRLRATANDELTSKLQRRLQVAESALCRIRQQVDWFTNNVVQQCYKSSVSKQFEAHLQTQLGELHDSLKYSDYDSESEEPLTPESPVSPGADIFVHKTLSSKTVTLYPAKSKYYSEKSEKSEMFKLKSEHDIHRLMDLQKELEDSQAKMIHSWGKLRDMSQQMSFKGVKSELEQYRVCAMKEQATLSRLQTEINTLLAKLAARELQASRMTQLIESLRDHLIIVQNQLIQGLSSTGQNLQIWIKTVQDSLSAAQAQLVEIERSAKLIKEEREEFARTQRIEETLVKSLQQEFFTVQQARLSAFEALCKTEQNQREDLNRLLASVIQHHDLSKREQVASDDMKHEINQLISTLSSRTKQLQIQEEKIQSLQQSLSESRAQSQRCHKRRSNTVDTDGDDEEGYHSLTKTQQEVETLRQLVNLRDRQILEKEQKINTLKKALSKIRSENRGGRYPNRVSAVPSMSKVGESDDYRQQTLQMQDIVSRIHLEVENTFKALEYRDQQFNRLVENIQETLDSAQGDLDSAATETGDDQTMKLKMFINKFQKSLKQFINKAQDFVIFSDTQEYNRTHINTLQSELETAQSDLLNQLHYIAQEEPSKILKNTAGCETLESLQLVVKENKKKMLEMETQCRSTEEQNLKLKQDLVKAQEELSRVRSVSSWRKTVTSKSDFKLNLHLSKFEEAEQNLTIKENTITQLQEDVLELTGNLQSRDKLIENQQETIQVLQNSLKLEHEESEELRKKIAKLESQKNIAKNDYQQKINELELNISSLQDVKKKSDEASVSKGWTPWSSKQSPCKHHVYDV